MKRILFIRLIISVGKKKALPGYAANRFLSWWGKYYKAGKEIKSKNALFQVSGRLAFQGTWE